MWRQVAIVAIANLVFPQRPPGCIFGDEGYCRVVLSKPDVVGCIGRDTVGLAIGSRCRNFDKGMVQRIEAAYLVSIVLGKPDVAIAIDGHIPWAGPGSRYSPLPENVARRVIHAN